MLRNQEISEANFDEEYVNNESINSIKKQEYKTLGTLHRLKYNNEYYQYDDPIYMKCNTEPSADVFIPKSNSTASFESSDLKRLNSQPFIPKFRIKQNSNQYLYREFNEEDEYEE